MTRSVADNSGNGLSNFFPLVVIDDRAQIAGLLPTDLNLSSPAEEYISRINHAAQISTEAGRRTSRKSRRLSSFAIIGHELFFHALATMHTPRYRTENAGALLATGRASRSLPTPNS